MDLVPLVNGLAADAGAASESISTSFSAAKEVLSANWLSWIVLTVFFVAAFAFVKRISGRVGSTLEDALFSNWRLALLGSTGLVLSLASGWTTWDGMRNFTNEPVLSFMITFGIQGVMLIVAWLIGESFATGMNTSSHAAVKGGIAGAVIFLLLLAGILAFSGVIDFQHYFSVGIGVGDTAILAIGIVIIAIVLFASGAEMFEPYMASTRVIVRNAVLWIMFLSCMATSVFFSFDSLFSTIFPKEERERAAQLRAQNQVAGIIADIGQTIAIQKNRESELLFRSDGWRTYETQLDTLAAKAQDSQKDIEAYFKEQLEERRVAIAEQRNRQSTAKSQQAGLQSRKVQLSEELSRLQSQRPTAANEVSDQQQVVREIERRVDEQRAVVLAEEKGVEGSGKVGKGPMWRAAKAEEAKIKAQLQVANERLRSPRERLLTLDKRIASIKGELARIDGELGNLQGEAQTAEDLIAAAQRSKSAEENADLIDPARILPAFERAKVEFRQEPTKERLSALQQQCSQLLSGMLATTATKDRVRDIDCDPKQAAEAAGILFTLNQGLDVFVTNCASGDKLEANKTTDQLFEFSRKCLADSGLPSQKTDELRTQINLAELNRDDRAHRFVVTWNAFQDGNRLAYLALAIAIAIDALVFMSGLFGANAVRSPLQDVPSLKPRSAKQLEQIVENALLPNKYLAAHATLEAMQPITPVDGFTQEVLTSRVDPSRRGNVIKVLNAGAAIGAVQNDPMRPDERHMVRPELFEYLSIVAKREFEANDEHVHLAELEQTITVALQPHPGDHAHIVLGHLTPITKREGDYSSVVMMENVSSDDRHIVNNVLNAGTLLGVVRHSTDKKNFRDDDYLIHGQLHKTLLRIAATHPMLGKRLLSPHQSARPSLAAPGASSSDITPEHGRVARSEHSLLSDHTGRSGARGGQRAPAYDDQGANRGGSHGSVAGSNDGGHYQTSTAHQSLVDYFANELSRQDDELEDIFRLGREVDIAALGRTLEAVVHHQPGLREKIIQSRNSQLKLIEDAHDRLTKEANIAPLELYDFKEELRRSVVLFILSDNGAYENHLEAIEREVRSQEAEGQLEPQWSRWVEALSRHLSELEQCDRRSLHGWSEVQRSLQRFDTALASLANNS